MERSLMPPEKLPATVSEATLAVLLGIAPRTLRDAAKAGAVVRAGRGGYDLAGSIAGYVRHIRSSVETRDTATNRLRSTKNEIAELALAERRRQVIETAEAEAIIDTVIGKIHAEFSGLPRRISRDPTMISTIDREVTTSLNRVADALDEGHVAFGKSNLEK